MKINNLKNHYFGDGFANYSVSRNTTMRLYSIPLLLLVTIFACSTNKPKDKIQFAPRGSLLLFDTASGKYIVSSVDKKLITTWELFRQAISKSDYITLKSFSSDSIVCPNCVSLNDEVVIAVDSFYQKNAKDLFSNSFTRLLFDSSKIRCSYDFDSVYFNAYAYLLTISDLEKPKVAQIFISYPINNGDSEGTSGILEFIETKQGHKFFGYSTIP